MSEYLEYMRSPVSAALISAICVTALAYFDSWYNKRDYENNYYGKVFVLVAVLVGGLVYMVNGDGFGKKMSGGGGGNITVNVKKLNSSNMDIMTDIPDF